MTAIPITRPFFDSSEERAIADVLKSGWIVQGPRVAEFEERVAAYCGAKYAVATSSCTTALHLGLLSLGVGPGDEVIVPSFTFIASANAIEYCGAKPVFCDIDLKTFTLDITQIEKLITEKTKAIMPVSLFGMPLDMDSLLAIATKHELKIIEDAACAMGAQVGGTRIGSQGAHASTFSFHPRKIITTGEGGLLLTDDCELNERVRSLRNHGAAISDAERHKTQQNLLSDYESLGYNYRMTDLQAAVGIEQMKKLETMLTSRREIACYYTQLLSEVDWIIPPIERDGWVHSFQSYVILLSPGGRRMPSLSDVSELEAVRTRIFSIAKKKGIALRSGTHAVHTAGYYRNKYGLAASDFANSFIADRLAISLPLYYGMTPSEVDLVIQTLKAQSCAV